MMARKLEIYKSEFAFYLSLTKDFELFLYQLKLVVAKNKSDEFIDSLRFISNAIREVA